MPSMNDHCRECGLLRQKLSAAEARFHNVVAKNADGMIIVDRYGIVRFHNPAAARMFKCSENGLIGQIFGFPIVANEHAEVELLRQGKSPSIVEMRTVDIEWEGEPMFLASLRDITDRKGVEDCLKASLQEKEVLLREIHHRVKNNLEVIISLIEMQSACVPDKSVIHFFNEIRERIWVIARVHEDLYHSDNLSSINFRNYLENLSNDMFSLYDSQNIRIRTDFSEIHLDIETAIPCGLIFIELLTNALKHAFPKDRIRTRECEIRCRFESESDRFILSVSDNGVGIPETFDWRNAKTMGLRLVNILTKQLDGSLDLSICNGTAFKLSFPKPKTKN